MYLANPTAAAVPLMCDGRLGLIDTPKQGSAAAKATVHAAGGAWCADNGCFGTGYPGDDAWFEWLSANAYRARTCLFAVAPDVVGDAAATLERSRPWLAKIRALGYRAALVAQDGLQELPVPWDEFDVLFVGGTTAWKLGPAARALVYAAKAHGKYVHMGRVNSERRYRYAEAIGCDSVDGTLLAFGPTVNVSRLERWRLSGNQRTLDLGDFQ